MPTTTNPFAKVIAHSSYDGGPDLITVQATGRRFILAELNTHRVLSKNSASSRAIPFHKQVRRILESLALPEVWPAEQKGMQGGEPLGVHEELEAEEIWKQASANAIDAAQELADLGVHKSVINRLLEPFMWHTVLMTGTAWENFFAQRCSPLAQPEIRVMAEAIRTAIQNSEPTKLEPGEWHLPYIDEQTRGEIAGHAHTDHTVAIMDGEDPGDFERRGWSMATKVSAARCARVSYLTQEGTRDIEADLGLYEKLTTAQPPHWSPLEHVATPWPENRQEFDLGFGFVGLDDGKSYEPATEHLPRVGNLLGWRSLRTEVEAARDAVTYR